jgi:hypothetical protein
LREEIRQHNVLSSAISKILSQVRKRGLSATLAASELPLWRRDMPRRITVGSEVLTIMVEALSYQPASLSFPGDEDSDALQVTLDLIDEAELFRELRQALPVDNLLAWLHERYPRFSDATVLRLYHTLIERRDWIVKPAESTDRQPLNTVRVTHYPHALRAATNEGQVTAP